MANEIGNFLTELRVENGESQRDMAHRLGISPALLSSLETGKRTIQTSHIEDIKREYDLDESQRVRFDECVAFANEEAIISLQGLSYADKKLAVDIAANFDKLPAEIKTAIKAAIPA